MKQNQPIKLMQDRKTGVYYDPAENLWYNTRMKNTVLDYIAAGVLAATMVSLALAYFDVLVK